MGDDWAPTIDKVTSRVCRYEDSLFHHSPIIAAVERMTEKVLDSLNRMEKDLTFLPDGPMFQHKTSRDVLPQDQSKKDRACHDVTTSVA